MIIIINNYNMNTQIFIEKSKKIHGDKYDYSKSIYINSYTKIIIICKIHGDFLQLSNNHYKYNCKKCANDNNKNNILLNNESKKNFIIKANLIHFNEYDYSKSEYINAQTKIIIICKIHGEFTQTPNNHLNNRKCPLCANINRKINRQSLLDEYLILFKNKFNDKYDYSNIKWDGSSTKINLYCKNHGNFLIFPYDHKNGKECPKCTFSNYSKKSINWLEYVSKQKKIFIQHAQNIGEYKIPNTKFKVDGYCKENNTIYEFYGDYWHGNPEIFIPCNFNKKNDKKFGKLYLDTLKREKIIIELGYNIITIWEYDWDEFLKKFSI